MYFRRVFLIVLDSFGIGELPDAANYGDEGSNTLKSCFDSGALKIPNLTKLGIFNIDGIDYTRKESSPIGAYGRCEEKSKGKDTTTGHWEICGLIGAKPFPTYPNGFPDEIMKEFEKQTGRATLCNKPYSGTDVIKDYGEEHLKTGSLIVYTSADSVFQIAAHEKKVPLEALYEYCRIARKILTGDHAVGRVIARPFEGDAPDFRRTSGRHDFSLVPREDTLLDLLSSKGYSVIPIGKIYDIFAGKGLQSPLPTVSNEDGMKKTAAFLQEDFNGLCFTNLVDFDMLYGHRNDVKGYTQALNKFDLSLGDFISNMKENDLLIITADHGCDPLTPSTDHSREYTPLLLYGKKVKSINLKTRKSFADIGKTVADIFSLQNNFEGKSFLKDIIKDDCYDR